MTRLVNVNFNWGYSEDKEAVQRKKEQLIAKLRMLNVQVSEEAIEEASYGIDWIITLDEYLDCVSAGISCTLRQEVKTKAALPEAEDALKMLQRAAEKASKLADLLPDFEFNQKCEVHMPGAALSTYNETMLLEDSCTDRLQDALGAGWRIIAACPQPNQHRPDYILGRFNPQLQKAPDGAARG